MAKRMGQVREDFGGEKKGEFSVNVGSDKNVAGEMKIIPYTVKPCISDQV